MSDILFYGFITAGNLYLAGLLRDTLTLNGKTSKINWDRVPTWARALLLVPPIAIAIGTFYGVFIAGKLTGEMLTGYFKREKTNA